MSLPLSYLSWIKDTGAALTTKDGAPVKVFELLHTDDNAILSEWAKHFRNQYCNDTDIDFLREATGKSRTEYLDELKFPTKKGGFGPGTRSGDFAEILVSDYLEYISKYWVPRTRYDRKTIRNESTKGSDVLAFKIISNSDSPDDCLAMYEVKAQLSGRKAKAKLQEAINHSGKDNLRKAESLNAIRQRFYEVRNIQDANKIGRFQNPADRPYKDQYGAVALYENKIYDPLEASVSDTTAHPNKNTLSLIIIKSEGFMTLVNSLYKRAADEA
ncbi:DUF1837 domain-containing protein [Pseudomonas mandelii]|nr:Hachiman antiphage defense system protein HamA [Pseudomonas mandelii]QZA96495.1 DUF1837 domain-containing protein [Pseudomonas mandelii]